MRILAIAQPICRAPGEDEDLGKSRRVIASHPFGYRGIVSGGQGESLARQRAARCGTDCAIAGRQFGNNNGVIGRVGDDGHSVMVLGGGADQRHAADIDILDAILGARVRRNRRRKRVEIAHEEIDRRDPPFGKRGEVIGPVPPGEETRMDGGVQGLDPAVEEFRYPGYLRHLGDRNPSGGQGLSRAAGRDNGDAACRQRHSKCNDAALVADRDQRAADREKAWRHHRGYRGLRGASASLKSRGPEPPAGSRRRRRTWRGRRHSTRSPPTSRCLSAPDRRRLPA